MRNEDKAAIMIALLDGIGSRDIAVCYLDVEPNHIEAEIFLPASGRRRIIGVSDYTEASLQAIGRELAQGAITWAEQPGS